MRKRNHFRQLSRTSTHKMAMLRNMVTSLIEHERIVTTVAKAKEVRALAEKIITMAKKGTARSLSTEEEAKTGHCSVAPNAAMVHARRQIGRIVRTDVAATKVITVLRHRYQDRPGGYTRIMKLARPRAGDKADMAVLEYVDHPNEIRAARPPPLTMRQMQMETMQNAQEAAQKTASTATPS
jgi:large subunit ribosomal protein L17